MAKRQAVTSGPPVLSRRALNRAVLSRQMLLERQKLSAATALDAVVGMQAQAPQAPYVGMWSRLVDFDAAELSGMIERREAVRIAAMRGTLHLVTAADALALKPVVQPAFSRVVANGGPYKAAIKGIDMAEVVAVGQAAIEEEPLTFVELRQVFAKRWPGVDPQALSWNFQGRAPLIQVPPRGLWRKGGAVRWTTIQHWLGQPMSNDATPDAAVLRYLGAFGPASVMDMQAWSGLTKLTPAFERLRPKLVTFADENGRELFDLPEAPRPDEDTPSAVRFLPEYDNIIIGYADRTRMGTNRPVRPIRENETIRAFLVDGEFSGFWWIIEEKRTARLDLEPVAALRKKEIAAVEAEGERLMAFAVPGAESTDIRWINPV